MKRLAIVQALGVLPLLPAISVGAATPIHVYKNPSCDCCAGWVKHLSAAGFAVQVTATEDTIAVRNEWRSGRRAI
jgi:hypothetical protein